MRSGYMKYLVVVPFLFFKPAFAAGCEFQHVESGGAAIDQIPGNNGECSISVSHADKPDLVYRNYIFDERGGFMIFNSVNGPEDTSAGARTYFMFPRKAAPSFSLQSDGTVQVSTASGNQVIFSNPKTFLQSISGTTFQEDVRVTMENNGGVEILSYSGIYLDTGWRVGTVAYADPKRSSVFKDSHGKTCQVFNSEAFTYTASGDARIAYAKDADLADFLTKRCPGLDVSSLQ